MGEFYDNHHEEDDLLPATPALDDESPFASVMSLYDEAAALLGVARLFD